MGLSPEQLELRRNLMTCSRLPMILGLSEYGKPIDVYNAMVFGEQRETNKAQRAGNRHETALLNEFAESHDCVLAIPEDGVYNSLLHEFKLNLRPGDSATFIYPEQLSVRDHAANSLAFLLGAENPNIETMENWFGGTPDSIIQRDGEFLRQLFDLKQSAVGAVVQAKLVNSRKAHEWGESQFGEPPQKVIAQVYGEIILAREVLKTDINFGFIVALIGEPTQADYRYYCIHLDTETEKLLLDKAREFWYIVQRREVEKLSPEGNWNPYFQHTWPIEKVEKVVDADGSAAIIWKELATAKRQAKQIDAMITGFENALKMKMGEAALLYADDAIWGKNGLLASWKKSKDSKSVDWESVAKALVAGKNGKVAPAKKKLLDNAVAKNTEIKQGVRRFLVKGIAGDTE